MPRMIDWTCTCGARVPDVMADEEDVRTCACGLAMQQDWLPRLRRDAQWDDRTAVLVFQNAEGQIRYPGRTDARCPAGYEPVRLRSLHEVERFERAHGVRNEMAWFDKGSGRGHDDHFTRRKSQLLPDGRIITRTVEEKVTY